MPVLWYQDPRRAIDRDLLAYVSLQVALLANVMQRQRDDGGRGY